MTPDLLAWLTTAMDAAQQDAEAAAERAWSPRWDYDDLVHEVRDLNNGNTLADIYLPEIGAFVVANDPAAALRRIAADRKLIAEHAQYSLPDGSEIDECRVCGGSNEAWPCPTLRILAEGYGWTEEVTP